MKNLNQKGQTLVILLIYMTIAVIITTASIALVINSARGTDRVYQGATSLDIAESGAETAMIKLLRDPNYSGETISIDGGEAEIIVTGTNPKTVTSQGTLNNFTRTIEVIVDTSNNTLSTISWREI